MAETNNYASYRWVITKDRITNGEEKGVDGPRNCNPDLKTNRATFSLWDDDGECYYEGLIFGDYEGFEPLDDFGMPNAGCTDIKIDGESL